MRLFPDQLHPIYKESGIHRALLLQQRPKI